MWESCAKTMPANRMIACPGDPPELTRIPGNLRSGAMPTALQFVASIFTLSPVSAARLTAHVQPMCFQ